MPDPPGPRRVDGTLGSHFRTWPYVGVSSQIFTSGVLAAVITEGGLSLADGLPLSFRCLSVSVAVSFAGLSRLSRLKACLGNVKKLTGTQHVHEQAGLWVLLHLLHMGAQKPDPKKCTKKW